MPKDPTIAVRDCLAEIAILPEIATRMTLQSFRSDPIAPRAAAYAIQTISEAVRHIPDDWLADFPTEPWGQIRGIGNRIRHEYFHIRQSRRSRQTRGELDFLPGISSNQLWFKQAGNDLLVQVMGGQDQVTVSNWFANGSARLQEIKAGGLEVDSGLSQLVQAMATYSANNPAFNPATASQAPNDPALQTAIAAAWHA